jgi:radical SAM protein with 4Fe4S-binding SPASM domain
MRQNEYEVQQLQQAAHELGVDQVCMTPIRTDTGELIFQNDEQKIDKSKEWLPQNEAYSRYDYKEKKRKNSDQTCKWLWSNPAVNPDGSISPCCAVYPEKLDFGNVLTDGFDAVWNNEKFVSARRVVAGKESELVTVCNTCVTNGFI